ncbi:hypothetical protein [Leptobacterium sp. I13]|uniref:hypothetical protein n=1 Tax=Leptobacterium meishanense TaxID=3128904 RepID=UPI0030EC8355
MSPFNIFILTILGFLIILLLYYFLRDVRGTITSFFRGMKNNTHLGLKIASSPIWLLAMLFNKIFKLDIFYSYLEDTSKQFSITNKNYQHVIICKTNDIEKIKGVIKELQNDESDKEFSSKLKNTKFKYKSDLNHTYLILKNIDFKIFKLLIVGMDNLGFHNVEGIMVNQNKVGDSFFITRKPEYQHWLIGRDNNRRRIYVDFTEDLESGDNIYYNKNINKLKMVDFKKINQLIS